MSHVHITCSIFLAGGEGVGGVNAVFETMFQHLLSVTQQEILTRQFVAMKRCRPNQIF